MDNSYFDSLGDNVKQFLLRIPPKLLEKAIYVSFAPDAFVVRKGAPVDYVYALMGGDVAVLNEFADGNSYIFASVGQCRFISTLELLAQQPLYAASLICTGTTKALRIPADSFMRFLDTDPAFLRNVAADLARSMYISSSSQGKNLYRPARERIAAYLINYCRSCTDATSDVRVQRTRQAIASNVGVSIKTVNRALSSLKDEGFLSIIHGGVCISPDQRGKLCGGFPPSE